MCGGVEGVSGFDVVEKEGDKCIVQFMMSRKQKKQKIDREGDKYIQMNSLTYQV